MGKLFLDYTLDIIRSHYRFGSWSNFRAPIKTRPYHRWTITWSSFYFGELWLIWTLISLSLLIISVWFVNQTNWFYFILVLCLVWLSYMIKEKYHQLRTQVDKLQNDLTKERRTQAETILQLYRFAAFGRIASGVFHDLANPLTTVSMSLEELNENRPSADLVQAIEGTERMRRFIEMARRQLQQQEHLTYLSVDDEINQSIAILNYRAKKRRVSVSVVSQTPVKTYGNSIKFQQALTNLIGNAIDAYEKIERPRNSCDVRIETATNIDTLTVEVTDKGCGIRPTDFEHIFEPFFTTKNTTIGTGIGLSITREIIEKDFGGQIKVSSQYGKGSTFSFTIPVRPKPLT